MKVGDLVKFTLGNPHIGIVTQYWSSKVTYNTPLAKVRWFDNGTYSWEESCNLEVISVSSYESR